MSGDRASRKPNVALRRAREQANLSQDDLVARLRDAGWQGCDRRTLQRYEAGHIARPQALARRALTQVLGLTVAELGFDSHPGDPVPSEPPQTHLRNPNPARSNGPTGTVIDEEAVEDVRRRAFLATTGLTAANVAFASESVRHGLLAVANGYDLQSEVEEWEAVLHRYGTIYLTTPAGTLMKSYLNDVEQLSCALHGRDQSEAVDLYRIGAYLSAMTAWGYGDVGDREAAVRWWRTAHRMASTSRHPPTQVWVAGQHTFMSLYDPQTPPDRLLQDIERYEPLLHKRSVARSAPGVRLIAAKAQVLAMAGRAPEAHKCMEALYDAFAVLPDDVTRDRSWFGWPESRLGYVESFVYSYLGDYQRASAAQDLALTRYPPGSTRDCAKIELMRALCLARSGAPNDAVVHTITQLNTVTADHHDLVMADLAGQVLNSVPPEVRIPEIADLQRYIQAKNTPTIEASR